MSDKLDTITVQGTKDDSRVVLFERHPDHPNGEAFVVNDNKAYDVAETAQVKRLIGQGDLVKTEKKPAAKTNVNPKASALPDGWGNFNDMTVDDIRERLKGSDKPLRDKLLAHERANKKRADVIETLVNWNS